MTEEVEEDLQFQEVQAQEALQDQEIISTIEVDQRVTP